MGIRPEVGGKAAEYLGLGEVDFDQFKNLLEGKDPFTGKQLTAKLVDNRLAGWDMTASMPKGVTNAINGGDSRAMEAAWRAVRRAAEKVQERITTRVRKGGAYENRVTGNMVHYIFPHPDTRPVPVTLEELKSSTSLSTKLLGVPMPDPDWHFHVVIPNVTYDAMEGEWKAIKWRPIMDDKKWFDRYFDMYLSSELADLGYGIETKYRAGKYYSWDIKGAPGYEKEWASAIKKNSRRSAEIEKLAAEMKVESVIGKDKLGATSRRHKRKDLTLEDCQRYWDGKMSKAERRAIAETIKGALKGKNPRQENTVDKGMTFAIAHEFEKNSVIPQKQLEITAMERSMGGGKPEEIEGEAKRQGVLFKGGEVTTQKVLDQEGRIIDFAREGRGTMRPLGIGFPSDNRPAYLPSRPGNTATLSDEQQALIKQVMSSTDRVQLIIGDAGTSKTTTNKPIRDMLLELKVPVAWIAPTAKAARIVQRREISPDADTVASFIYDKEWQASVKNGVILMDEANMCAIDDLEKVCEIAKQQNARLILQGDPKQHRSVARSGNMLEVLEQYAGLKPARLKETWRFKHAEHKKAMDLLAAGKFEKGFEILDKLGWIKYHASAEDVQKALADDYLNARGSFLATAPIHRDCEAAAQHIREGLDATETRTLPTLSQLGLSEAEKADSHSYDGTEVLVFRRSVGAFKAGQSYLAKDVIAGDGLKHVKWFDAYNAGEGQFAVGDWVAVTKNGQSLPDDSGRKHRIDNGYRSKIAAFEGDVIVFSNGWKTDTKHIRQGFVSTSMPNEGETYDNASLGMTRAAWAAINQRQTYVDWSRIRYGVTIHTDMTKDEFKEVIQRQGNNKSATELLTPHPSIQHHMELLRRHRRRVYEALRERHFNDMYQRKELSRGYHK